MDSDRLKKTIILPKTNFHIKRKLEKDFEILLEWEKKNIYKKSFLNKENGSFVVHDGPPYANGPIHIGHFVNRILKDFIIRYYNSVGFKTPLVLGWDTHGLPIEFKVLNNLKSKNNKEKSQLSEKVIRKECREYAFQQIELQKEQLKKIGIFTDFGNYYSTQDFSYQAKELRILSEIARKNLIYRGLKPVYWSWHNKTALAENEVEYIEKKDYSLFFKISLVESLFGYEEVKLVVWTTQPWTLPFNELIAVNGEENYFIVENKDKENFIFSENFINSDFLKDHKLIIKKKFKGFEISGKRYKKIYYEKNSPCFSYIIDSKKYVSIEEGTGLLHIAPSCGPEDFEISKLEGINVESYLDENGRIKKNFFVEELKGIFYQDANEILLKDLSKKNKLFHCEEITHNFPHDWRDKTPLVYRLTDQWFIDLSSLKESIKKNIEKVYWFPENSKEKMISFIEKRNDWCISRQRSWGLPIPSIIRDGKHEIIPEIVDFFANFVEKFGSDFWFDEDCKKYIQEKFELGENFELGKETLDVWFDSGISSFSALEESLWPADVYLEGKDQFRGWFNSSLIISTLIKKEPPYKSVISHGFVVDENGKKMSKSLGNALNVEKLIEDHGIDVMRLWVSSFDFSKEIKIGNDIILKVKNSYQKIRNTLRFIVGNINSSFQNSEKFKKNFDSEICDLSKYILSKTWRMAIDCKDSFFNKKFSSIYSSLNNFCVNDLSSFYFEIVKDTLYCDEFSNSNREETVFVLYSILQIILKIISPLVPFVADELYKEVNIEKDEFFGKESVHLVDFPSYEFLFNKNDLRVSEIKFEKYVIPTRKAIFQEIENFRKNISINNLKAKIFISICETDHFEYLSSIKNLNSIFMVSEVFLEKNSQFSIKIEESSNKKCERCWKFENSEKNTCARCSAIINKI